jgi:hypothetical protein
LFVRCFARCLFLVSPPCFLSCSIVFFTLYISPNPRFPQEKVKGCKNRPHKVGVLTKLSINGPLLTSNLCFRCELFLNSTALCAHKSMLSTLPSRYHYLSDTSPSAPPRLKLLFLLRVLRPLFRRLS